MEPHFSDENFDIFGHRLNHAAPAATSHGRSLSRSKPRPLPHHCSIALWGGGRIHRNSKSDYAQAVEYRNGSVKYLHSCHFWEFGYRDLVAAASLCNFQTGIPTLFWYIRPDTFARNVQVYIALNNDADVRKMFRLYNNLAIGVVQVYSQDLVHLKDPVSGELQYVLPHYIPRSELRVETEEVRKIAETRLEEKAALDGDDKGVREALGKTWYLWNSPVPVLPCRNPTYNLRRSPFRGITERKLLVEGDPIREDMKSRSKKRRVDG